MPKYTAKLPKAPLSPPACSIACGSSCWAKFYCFSPNQTHSSYPNFVENSTMILPVLKFVVLSLALFLLLLWLTSPNFWLKISSSVQLVGEDPYTLLNLPSGLLFSGEAVVKSLTCNNLGLEVVDHALPVIVGKKTSAPPLAWRRATWDLSSLVLMGWMYISLSCPLGPLCDLPFEQLSQFSTGWHPATYCLPGAPFGPVHFKKYPLKPEYRDYFSDKILVQDPLVQSKELTRYNRKALDKYNFLSAYHFDIRLSITTNLIPASTSELSQDHFNTVNS
ncbi:hypothetical protein DSO57_1000163 [Entomophthora muscae]|uniref:Uncharacterized protein n=1 Tax=Entomophthora muscae TaxID=34485 RepID=A0ACC2T954_9FUNG|nr:hypothetical protein DSO57_1000163 [Entomophthora muscae]